MTRATGASRSSNACSWISAARLAPTPPCGQPSSTITARLVLLTDSRMVSRSSGRSVRGSITSASTSCSLDRMSAAFWAVTAIREMPTIVTSSPSRRMAAWPKLRHVVLVVGHVAALAVEVLVLDEERPGCRRGSPPSAGPWRRPPSTATASSIPGTCRYSASRQCECVGPELVAGAPAASAPPSAPWPARRTCSGSSPCG